MKTEDKMQVVERLRRLLDPKENARRLLDYLVDQEASGNHMGLPESELLLKLFPPPGVRTLEQAKDAITAGSNVVRKAVGKLRPLINRFAASPECRSLPVTLILPDGEYRVIFQEHDRFVKKLWRPYLDSAAERELLMVYTENVFFRSLTERYFLRHLDLNDPSLNPKSKCDFIPDSHLPLQAARQFVSSGDVSALLFLTTWFERLGIKTDFAVAHQSASRFLSGKNLILIGNRRTFPLLHRLIVTMGFNFQILDDRILNSSPLPEDPPSDGLDQPDTHSYIDRFGAPGFVRGLVLRKCNVALGSEVTIIASNSGRFHEAVSYYLTHEHTVATFLNWLGIEEQEPIPPGFEALLEVAVEEHEDNPRPTYQVQPLAKRVYRK